MADKLVASVGTHRAAGRSYGCGLLLATVCAAAMASERACSGLEAEAPTYRLDSHPGLRSELALRQGFRVDGVDYRATLTANPRAGVGDAPAGLDIRQLYLEGKGYGLAPNTAFWTGRRTHLRTDARAGERFITDLSGVGTGFDAPLGAARLGLSYFRTDANAVDSGRRLNVDAHEIGTIAGGRLRLVGTLTQGSTPGGIAGTPGLGLIAMHTQDRFLGLGSHTLWLAYAQGSAALDGNFGGPSDPASNRRWRVVQSLGLHAGAFSGHAQALWERDRNEATSEWRTSVSGRGTYTAGSNLRLEGELALAQLRPKSAPMQKLSRLTLAPTFRMGSRRRQQHELSLYASHAWGRPDTHYGAHAQVWF